MNNDTYRTLKTGDPAVTGGKVEETRLAVALDKIIRNRDWRVVVEQYLQPRLQGAREHADRLEGAELFRFQGEIRILKTLINLQTALTAQQNTIEHEEKPEDGTDF